MALHKHIRELVRFADKLGIETEVVHRGNTHLQLKMKSSRGDTYNMIVGASPSDHLAVKNNQSRIRRFAKGVMDEYTRK